MNPCVRTKDGKIWDTTRYYYGIRYGKPVIVGDGLALYSKDDNGRETYCGCGEIVKQEDSIEKLIEVGDLVKAKYKNVYGVLEEGVVEILSMEHFSKGYINKICTIIEITELYTKQGRNYVPVWTKEEGVI